MNHNDVKFYSEHGYWPGEAPREPDDLKDCHRNAGAGQQTNESQDLLRLLYERTKDIDDCSANDGDGRIDEWQSTEFSALLKQIKEHLNRGESV